MNELLEWTNNYLINRDLTLKKIVSIKIDEKNGIVDVKFKDKEVKHHVIPILNDKILSQDAGNIVIVCLNSTENFKFLIKNWSKLSKIKNFSIIFVSIKNNDKWLINPYVHSMIADQESLESGLRAMFDSANGELKEPKMEKKKPKMFDDDVADVDDSEEE